MLPQSAVQVAGAVAVNCCVAFSERVICVGEMEKPAADVTVSVAVAVYAGPLEAVAVMVQTEPGEAEAVNCPPGLMLPQEADQFTF